MTPQEVCTVLDAIGANVSRRTLLHYEEAGLIPIPKRGGGGRPGRYTDYPERTVEEAYAAWSFIHGKYGDIINSPFGNMTPRMPPVAIKTVRDLFYSNKTEDSRTSDDAKIEYLKLSGQIIKDMGKYLESDITLDEFEMQMVNEYLTDSSIKSVGGMNKATWGFLAIWQSECLKARALMIIKKIK